MTAIRPASNYSMTAPTHVSYRYSGHSMYFDTDGKTLVLKSQNILGPIRPKEPREQDGLEGSRMETASEETP